VKKYTKTDEWLELLEGNKYRFGITDFAQEHLTDIIHVELPECGAEFSKGDVVASVDSTKASAEIYAPVDLKVLEVNERVSDDPSLINADAEGEGYLLIVEVKDPSQLEELMSEEEYKKYLEEREE